MSSDPSNGRRQLRRPSGLIVDPAHALGTLRSIDAKVKPNVKRAIPAVLLALVCYGIGDHLGGIDGRRSRVGFGSWAVDLSKGQAGLVVLGFCLAFLIAGVIATRSLARELSRVSTARGGPAAGSAISLVVNIVGYATVFLGLLSLLRVDLGNLLVGGAVTGVVVGIAAQQTLGNFFAGLVLLFARPFVPGQRVRVNTGAMGGPFEGTILNTGLIYTNIDTATGVVAMPNAGVLGAAIGPVPDSADESDDAADPAGTPSTGSGPIA
ncbi:MAG TPA: mechanosensitive ion channel family protein [Jatrophihabitans sp.]|nr:mechanosensitive ion channel family protein [Jatrophihabitans sp.]